MLVLKVDKNEKGVPEASLEVRVLIVLSVNPDVVVLILCVSDLSSSKSLA